MEWISGVSRDADGCLCVGTQSTDGSERLGSLVSVNAELKKPSGTRRRASLSLHAMATGSTRDYLDGLGYGGWCADGQSVYEAESTCGTLIIPAQLLVFGLFGSCPALARAILTPTSPAELGHLVPAAQGVALEPSKCGPLAGTRITPATTARLEWLLAYPSAVASWASVYRNALDGRLAMSLPKATMTVAVGGCKQRGRVLVTSLEVLTLIAEEEPHHSAVDAKREFSLSPLATRRPSRGPQRPSGDIRFKGAGPVSEQCWTSVESVILAALKTGKGRGRPDARIYRLRDLLDAVILKLGTGCSWAKLPLEKGLRESAMVLFSKLERAGAWERVVSELGVA